MQAPRTRIKPTALAAAALTAVLVSALCGCDSSGVTTNGPLSGGAFGATSGGADCAPARIGHPVTFGDERFTNHGRTALALDRVALLHPHNEHLVGSYAVLGVWLIGVENNWPPKYSGMPPTWKHRQSVRGFRLAPGKSFNMVLGVAATGTPRASSPGMVIYYHDSAGSYVTRNRFAMIIAVNKPQCEPSTS